MMLFKNDITHAAGALQLSAGQNAGIEAVVHSIHDIFSEENTEVVLLIDAENGFNRKVSKICNCYAAPARFFIFGGGEILSKEGTT